MAYCPMLLLFLTAVAASPRFQLPEDAEAIQNALQQLLAPKANREPVRKEHDHSLHHSQEHNHDSTNIETLNFIFKHNKIVPPATSQSKTIARASADRSSPSLRNDLMCKLGVRCGCGGNAERCGCKGRSGGTCEADHDHTLDNAIILPANPDYIRAEGKNSVKDKKNRADPTVIKLLDDLEKYLFQNAGNQNTNYRDDDNRDDDSKKSDSSIDGFLKDVEIALKNGDKDDENTAHLRCCQQCSRRSFFDSSEDDKTYLRCCKKCSRKKYFRADDKDASDDRDQRDRSSVRDHRDRSNNRDRRDRSDVNPIERARIFQINDDLDAIVLDVSDVDNVLKLLNNANNYDNTNSIRDYVRAVTAENPERKLKVPKYKNSLQPTFQQKMKVRDIYRRSGGSDAGKYGVPFELDVQALGQVNS